MNGRGVMGRCAVHRVRRRWRVGLACVGAIACATQSACLCGRAEEPSTLAAAAMVEQGAPVFLALDTKDGIQELRIEPNGTVTAFTLSPPGYTQRAAMLPSRPEICRITAITDTATGEQHSVVEWLDPTKSSQTPRRVVLGAASPSAILAMGERCLVAFEGKVEGIDFTAEPPARKTLHAYDQPAKKPIDTFARNGSRIIGVDDTISPKFAFVYDLGPDGALHWKYTGNLDSLINGTYGQAVLTDGWLVAMTYEVYRGGESQALQLFRVGATELKRQSEVTESSSRYGGSDESLAGEGTTTWRSFGAVSDRILVCASGRGILALPPSLPKGVKASVLEAGGPCDDMLVVDNRVYVLETGGRSAPGRLRAYGYVNGKLEKAFERDLGVWAREIFHVSSRVRQPVEIQQ